MTLCRHVLILLLIFIIGFLVRLDLFSSNLDRFVEIMPDDAFYYFEIALRIWQGQGFTLDGTAPATGFHVLWLALVLPFFHGDVAGDPEPIRMVLGLGWILAGLASFQVYRFASHVMKPHPFWFGALLGLACSLNFYLVVESLNGLETALAVFLLVSLAVELYRYLEEPRIGRLVLLTMLSCLVVFARSDLAIIVACFCVILIIRKVQLKNVAFILGGAVVAVVVICLYSFITTGHPLQSSSIAMPWVIHDSWRYFQPHMSVADFHYEAIEVMWKGLGMAVSPLGWLSLTLIAGSSVVLIILGMRSREKLAREVINGMLICFALFVGIIGLHLVHGYVRWYPRPWYFVYWVPLAYMLSAVAVKAVLDTVPKSENFKSNTIYAVFVLLTIAVGAWEARNSIIRLQEARYPWQPEMVLAGKKLADHVPAGSPVGSFNAGIISYMTDVTVVNLDGAVNSDAARYIRNRRLGDYLCKRGIRHLVDYPGQWGWYSDYWRALGPYLGEGYEASSFNEMHRFDIPGIGCPSSANYISLVKIPMDNALCSDATIDKDPNAVRRK